MRTTQENMGYIIAFYRCKGRDMKEIMYNERWHIADEKVAKVAFHAISLLLRPRLITLSKPETGTVIMIRERKKR